MSDHKDSSSGVKIGNVTGGITNSIIAGRDVSNATITVAGKDLLADKTPSLDEFKQLLGEIQQELEKLGMQQEALKAVSAATPFAIQGVKANIETTAELVKEPQNSKPEEKKTLQAGVTEAADLLGNILENANKVAEKASNAGKAVQPLIELLAPLAKKVAVAALWAAKLWIIP